MWIIRLLVSLVPAGITFLLVYRAALQSMREKAAADAQDGRLAGALEATAHPLDPPLTAPFSHRPVLAYAVDVRALTRGRYGSGVSKLLHAEAAGRVGLAREGRIAARLELGNEATHYPETPDGDYPIAGVTQVTHSKLMGGEHAPPHMREFARAHGFEEALDAKFLEVDVADVLFNERVILAGAPLFVAGPATPDGDGLPVYRGAVTWGEGALTASLSPNKREAARGAFWVALPVLFLAMLATRYLLPG